MPRLSRLLRYHVERCLEEDNTVQLYINSADPDEIEMALGTGFICGITTNPSLLASRREPLHQLLSKLATLTSGHLHVQATRELWEDLVHEGEDISQIAQNVAVKLPMTSGGIKACKVLSERKVTVNMTLCLSSTQALLAAKAGADFVSVFSGRLRLSGSKGSSTISSCQSAIRKSGSCARVIAASITSLYDFDDAARGQPDIATVPLSVLKQIFSTSISFL